MRVLWFSNTPSIASNKLKTNSPSGGWIYSLANELRDYKKIKLAIAFYHSKDIFPFNEYGVSFYPIYNGLGNKNAVRKRKRNNTDEDTTDLSKFKEVIFDFKPDVIHIHGTEMAFGKIIYDTKIPVVVSIQGNTTIISHFYFRGISKSDTPKYYFKKAKLRISPFIRDYYLLNKRAKREQDFAGKLKFIIGRTCWDRRIFSILSPRAYYFHNDEILRKEFYLKEWKIKKREIFSIYTTNSNLLYKGFETVLDAANLLENNIGLNFIWKIGGLSYSDSIFKLLKNKYDNNLLENRIQLLSRLSASQIVSEMLNTDLYVMPSHIENSPNNLCEAMIMGVPCIATYAGGTSSILKDGKEGILVQDGDPWSLAGAILEIYRNKEKAVEFGKNARIRALHRHNPDKITNELVKIYSTILNKEKGLL